MASSPRLATAPRWVRPITRGARLIAAAGMLALALPMLALPAPAIAADESPTPTSVATEKAATERPVPLDKASRPVRIWVPYVGIDLPVISSDRNVAGNPRGYPLCDVAQYWTRFALPGKPGTTWIIGHAQPGMFLPLYEHTYGGDPDELLDKLVKLQLRDGRLLTYRIIEIRPRAAYTDVSIAQRPNKKQQRLVLQTSTGIGTDPKLQVAAKLVDAEWTDEPRPTPHPRACWQPTPKPTPKGQRPRATAAATPAPVETGDQGEPPSAMTLVLGSGAVLLGATVLAVYIVRRP